MNREPIAYLPRKRSAYLSLVAALVAALGAALCAVACLLPAFSQTTQVAPKTAGRSVGAELDGQRDFDFNIGTWKSDISRLEAPLSGSAAWTKWSGTVVVDKVWDGRANLEVLEADGPGGHVEALALRLYNPQSHQWTLNAASSDEGTLSKMTGKFRNGRGEFLSQEAFNGRTILIRQVWSDITAHSHHFEQAFSDDGGKTWEPNWKATLTRVPANAQTPHHPAPEHDRSHDFDFNAGRWAVQLSRLQEPLAGSTKRIDVDGTAMVRKVWEGRAYLEEIEISDPKAPLQGLALRLYNPATREWNLYWANSGEGAIEQPLVGGFKNGRGEFLDQELFHNKTILTREVWSDITTESCHFEQSFSNDGGKTWETNWVVTWKREKA